MKMKLTLHGPLVVEAEGTPEELAQLTERLSPIKTSYDYTEMHRLLEELTKLNEKQTAPYPLHPYTPLAPLVPIETGPWRGPYNPTIIWCSDNSN